MPRISAFYGIVIHMYWPDHPPPHFHARYGEYEALIAIDSLEILRGELPARARRLCEEWASLHRDQLHENWSRARRHAALRPIDPLP